MAECLFYPLDVPPFIEGSVKEIKKSVSPFLFKWIHRELCDAWQRTWGNNQMVETENLPWVLKLCLPCSNDSLNKLLYCSDVNMAALLSFFSKYNFFYLSKRIFIPA